MAKKPFDPVKLKEQAVHFAQGWLAENQILPSSVEVDEEQFAQVMNTVLRGLVQAYAAGAVERK